MYAEPYIYSLLDVKKSNEILNDIKEHFEIYSIMRSVEIGLSDNAFRTFYPNEANILPNRYKVVELSYLSNLYKTLNVHVIPTLTVTTDGVIISEKFFVNGNELVATANNYNQITGKEDIFYFDVCSTKDLSYILNKQTNLFHF